MVPLGGNVSFFCCNLSTSDLVVGMAVALTSSTVTLSEGFEAYDAIKEWMDFRASFGEEITGESWILRNTWQKVKPRYSHRIGLAKYPKPFANGQSLTDSRDKIKT
jgi:hypothetical protein